MRQGFLNELLTIICQTCGFCQQSSEKCLELFVCFLWIALQLLFQFVYIVGPEKPHWNLTATREVRDYILLVLGDCLLN